MQRPGEEVPEGEEDGGRIPSLELTTFLNALGRGETDVAETLMPHIHKQLLAIAGGQMRQQSAAHTLQPAELVNEAFLRLFPAARVDWRDRRHFFALAARVMRQLLVDHARRRQRLKRGAGQRPLQLDQVFTKGSEYSVDLIDLDLALEELSGLNELQGRVVELRYFGGLEVAEVAAVLEVSKRTVERHWRAARAWLRHRLQGSS